MFKKSLITKALFTATIMASAQASAAGFQVNVQSASALANANAGFAANTENAAVIGSNPAAAASFDKFAFSFGGAYIEPTVETTGENSPLAPYYQILNNKLPDQQKLTVPDKTDYDVESSVNAATVPSVYAVIPVGKNLAIGLAGYTNYGTDTEFPDDYAAGLLGGSTKLTTFNFNPSIAAKLGSKLRLGVGAQIVYGSADLERNAGDGAAARFLPSAIANPTIVASPQVAGALAGMGRSKQAFEMQGDGFGFGWNAGLLLDLNKNHKIGVSYRSPVEITFEGDYSGDKGAQTGQLDLSLPAMAELGGFHRFGNVALQYGVVWTEWSSFDGLKGVAEANNDTVLFEKAYSYEDSMRYSVGLSYYLGDNVILRGGYALDEKAGDTTISIPDSERQWYTAGLTFKLSNTLSLDLTAAYILGEETSFEEYDAYTKQTYAFSNKAEGVIGSAQINMVF